MSEIAIIPVTDKVLQKVTEFEKLGQLSLPEGYHAGNALKSAQLVLAEVVNTQGVPALQCCTTGSIANALLEMVVQGLSPISKQCYFIVRGSKLCLQRSYAGTMALAKREYPITLPKAHCIYEDDIFEYETDITTGRVKITKHKSDLKNRVNTKIIGAFCIIPFVDGSSDVEIMSIAEIRQSWLQGAAKGNSPAHKNFPDQMAEKTVINRALKRYVNSFIEENDFFAENEIQPDNVVQKDAVFETINIEAIEPIDTTQSQSTDLPTGNNTVQTANNIPTGNNNIPTANNLPSQEF